MAQDKDSPAIKFNFIKSNYFRVIHLDGAYGGLTPNRYIHMTVYSERMAIPRETQRELLQDGTLGKESVIDTKEGVVRELEADLIFGELEAIALRDWLNEKIEALKEIREGD